MMREYEAFDARLKEAGALEGGEGLEPTSSAVTLRCADGEPVLTDGPFAETREQLGGFYVVECKDLEEALGWAAQIPGLSAGGCVEVRPVIDSTRRLRLRDVPGAAIDRLFRRESGQAVAVLARALGDLDRAEEAVQDAFVVALERWPRDGVPSNPAAWIVTAARNRAIDRLRSERRRAAAAPAALARDEAIEPEATIPDERLELIFACCHPALAPSRAWRSPFARRRPLHPEVARRSSWPGRDGAAPPARQAQDARRRHPLRAAARGGPARAALLRPGHALPRFSEGYAATAGDALVRRDLCAEAIRLARVLCVLMPREPEALGAARADAAARLPAGRPRRRGRRDRAARRPGPRALGPRGDRRRGRARRARTGAGRGGALRAAGVRRRRALARGRAGLVARGGRL